MKLEDIQGNQTIEVDVASVATGTSDEQVAFVAPFNCTVVSAKFTPAAAITGNDTNNHRLDVRNRGTDASGSTDIATYTWSAGNDGVAFVPTDLTVTAANAVLAEGDVVTLEKVNAGSGLALPDGKLTIEIQSGG